MLTIVVDGANVMGSRPDGWWRDRAGAAVRLYDDLVRLAGAGVVLPGDFGQAEASGEAEPANRAGPADQAEASGQAGSANRAASADQANAPGHAGIEFVLVLEGAARAAMDRIPTSAANPAAPTATTAPTDHSGPPRRAERASRSPGRGGPGGASRPGESVTASNHRTEGGSGGCGLHPPVNTVAASGSGDDAIVAVVRELAGRCVVVTADRELRRRCEALGASILGPGWLLAQFRRQPGL